MIDVGWNLQSPDHRSMMAASGRQYLSSLEQLGIKLGLEQIRALVDHLGRPDRAYRSIVVAGTNGKGSVTAMVERGLRAVGCRTGRYTSPHLVDVEERVAIDGRQIAAEEFERVACDVRAAAERLPAPPSFFEATTAVALEAFRRARIDVAVLEVGLGGRLDATNVVCPMGVAITSVDFDHEQYLGQSLEAIAREKAGVIKPGSFAVVAENSPVVRQVIRARCLETEADFVPATEGVEVETAISAGRSDIRLRTRHADYGQLTLGLRGRHQIANAVTAVRLLEELDVRSLVRVPAAAVRTALTDVDWPARLEPRRWRDHDVLIDGAHNPAGARALASYLHEVFCRRLPFVIGVMRDKEVTQIVEALAGSASCFVCTAPNTPRAVSPAELSTIARQVAPDVDTIAIMPPVAALARAVALGTPAVVAGSLYLAGEIRVELT